MIENRILGPLNPRQRDAVAHEGSPLLVLAGAGSGKTRVLTSKVAWLIGRGIPAWRILAVTFTNKAAREMRDRVESMVGPDGQHSQVSTFHSFGLHMLFRNRDILEVRGYRPNFVVFDRNDCLSLVKKLMKEHGPLPEETEPSWVLECISRGKVAADPTTMKPILDDLVSDLYDRYQLSLKTQGAFDFDDLILMPLHLLTTDGELLERERGRLDWIMVDEYQDVNRPQFTLIRLLNGGSPNLMVVGDPDQSIYGWRGADLSVILDFKSHFPGATVVLLEQNYRSSGTILEAANSVIGNNLNRPKKRLWTDRDGGELIKIVSAGDERDEAHMVMNAVEFLIDRGYRYSDVAVLYRMNALSRNFEQECMRRGVPYRVVKGMAFYDRKEIKDVVSYLRLAVNPRDTSALERIANVPARGLGAKGRATLERFLVSSPLDPRSLWSKVADEGCGLKGKGGTGACSLAGHMLAILGFDGDLNASVSYILDIVGYGAYLDNAYPDQAEERRENVMELTSLALRSQTLEDILAEIALYTDQELAVSVNGVNLSSLHAAKGLEFPVVFMVGMEEGIFPHSRALDGAGDDLEEERRLCYVGMTRAEERLYLSYVTFRRLFGSIMHNDASRFVWEIPKSCRDVEVRGKGGTRHVRFGGYRGYRGW
ncbi:MAG: ATP-dependent DNA helicase PcrA [Dethiosulfovibrio peptidovorans]|nr:MAG: ATP-dependent DNA helicase PcrA [Dethiosulfovibrio peptidovorans]